MSTTALVFMGTVWTIIVGMVVYTLGQVLKHSK